jgi:hypothetical protein
MLKIDLNIGRKQKRFDQLKGILTQKRKHNMPSFEWGSHNDMPQRNMSCLKHKPIFLHSATHKYVNKLYLLRRTQCRFISIQNVLLHVYYMFRPGLRPSSGMSVQKLYEGSFNKVEFF